MIIETTYSELPICKDERLKVLELVIDSLCDSWNIGTYFTLETTFNLVIDFFVWFLIVYMVIIVFAWVGFLFYHSHCGVTCTFNQKNYPLLSQERYLGLPVSDDNVNDINAELPTAGQMHSIVKFCVLVCVWLFRLQLQKLSLWVAWSLVWNVGLQWNHDKRCSSHIVNVQKRTNVTKSERKHLVKPNAKQLQW